MTLTGTNAAWAGESIAITLDNGYYVGYPGGVDAAVAALDQYGNMSFSAPVPTEAYAYGNGILYPIQPGVWPVLAAGQQIGTITVLDCAPPPQVLVSEPVPTSLPAVLPSTGEAFPEIFMLATGFLSLGVLACRRKRYNGH